MFLFYTVNSHATDPWQAWCIVNFIPSSNVNPSRVACGLRGVTAAAVNRIRRHRLDAKEPAGRVACDSVLVVVV